MTESWSAIVGEAICRALQGMLGPWGDSLPDCPHNFFDPSSLLHLNLKLQKDSSNHRKIGNINEALQICKQSTQTASVYLNAFRSNSLNSERISLEDCLEMAKAKWSNFIQS